MENVVHRYYFDTSIWIDIYDKRGLNGEFARKLMEKIILNDNVILYSDIVIAELKKLNFLAREINQMLSLAKPDNAKRIHSTRGQIKEANTLGKKRDVPRKDALHAILARDHSAQLVTRDWDFEKLKDITLYKKPEDLI